jgi:hypothetical protein
MKRAKEEMKAQKKAEKKAKKKAEKKAKRLQIEALRTTTDGKKRNLPDPESNSSVDVTVQNGK